MPQQELLDECKVKMEKCIDSFKAVLKLVRTGTANVGMLEPVNVDYYGSPTPINQIASITIVEGTQLVIKPFDPTSLKNIEKAIQAANLGFNPINDGSVIRVNVPKMTEEVRKATVKDMSKQLEEAKVSVRNVRRDLNDEAKKDKTLTEDMQKDTLERVQKLTDDFIKQLDVLFKAKSDEVMKI